MYYIYIMLVAYTHTHTHTHTHMYARYICIHTSTSSGVPGVCGNNRHHSTLAVRANFFFKAHSMPLKKKKRQYEEEEEGRCLEFAGIKDTREPLRTFCAS
jgi:hypothetical protein